MAVDTNHLKKLIAGFAAGGGNSQAQLVAFMNANGTNMTLTNAVTYVDEYGQTVVLGVANNGRDIVKGIIMSKFDPNASVGGPR